MTVLITHSYSINLRGWIFPQIYYSWNARPMALCTAMDMNANTNSTTTATAGIHPPFYSFTVNRSSRTSVTTFQPLKSGDDDDAF
ncbi:hypothetical protein LZ554_001664 [Drepanopeziza brunnea f. sp. 'monogermtubi']|nr:hypothetical protein LZ554_001664 [Drepanopeziza brunnea f. sp. 'monogermtubi']